MVVKCYCPLTFVFNYLSFLLFFLFFTCIFFHPNITRLFLRKYGWPWVVEQDFDQNFLDRSTLHGLHDCAHFFISFMVWRISLMPSAKLSVTIQQYKGGGSTWVVMYSSCMNGLNVVATKQACVYVVVQFYPWFKFSFFSNSLSCYYHTLPYPKTKEKKIWTKDKIEPQHIHLIKKRRLTVLSRKVYFVKTFRDDAFQKRLKVSWWYAPTLTCARHIRDLHS